MYGLCNTFFIGVIQAIHFLNGRSWFFWLVWAIHNPPAHATVSSQENLWQKNPPPFLMREVMKHSLNKYYKSPKIGSSTKIVNHIQKDTRAKPPHSSQNSFLSFFHRSTLCTHISFIIVIISPLIIVIDFCPITIGDSFSWLEVSTSWLVLLIRSF